MPEPPAATATAPTDDTPLLQVEDLSVSFGGSRAGRKRVQAADGVSMAIHPRQTLAVVGESGSGKSVTALSVLQLIPTPPGRYDGGRVLWRGGGSARHEDLLTRREADMRKVRGNQIAMIFQEPMTSLNPVYSIGEQILEAILLHQEVTRAAAVDIAAAALKDVGIADPAQRLKEYPHQLSGGMRQRVMIAMALACQPTLLLADEPTTALDVTIQAQILELLRKLQNERDMAVMLITHDLGVVAENADVVAVMFAGRVLEVADVHTLFKRPLHPYTRGLLASMPRLGEAKKRLPTVMDAATIPDDFPGGYTVRTHDPDASLASDTRYGGDDAHLHEVEDDHWVLCTPKDGEGNPTFPALTYRRHERAKTAAA